MTDAVAQPANAAAENHYDASYFAWQRSIGVLGGIVNQFRWQQYIRNTDRVVDFGCGGGYLLATMNCAERRGVEVNPAAREEAQRNGITCVSDARSLPDDWADVVMSNSCLEHVEEPLTELRTLLTKLRTGGRLLLGVPNETIASRYRPNDINQHLYSWSPMTAGNLVTRAGFVVDEVRIWRIMRPPFARAIYRIGGHRGYRLAAGAYRLIRLALSPVRPVPIHADVMVIAHRPAASTPRDKV